MAESIFTGQTPGSTDVEEFGGINTAVTFTSNVAGQITGIRFFAPLTVSGTFTGTLYEPTTDDDPEGSGTGTSLGSGTLAGGSVTPGAWNVITLSAPVDIDANKGYRAAVHASNGRYVASGGVFASGGITNGHLTAIQTGANPTAGLGSLLNGTFRVGGAVAYPSNTFNGGNYFVDVVFEPDAVPPGQGTAAIGLGLALAGVGDAPGVDPGEGTAGLGLQLSLAAIGNTPGGGQGTASFSVVLAAASAGAGTAPRAVAPSEGSRLVYRVGTSLNRPLLAAPLTAITIYQAESGPSLADIRTLAGGVISGSVLVADQWSQLPLFRMPVGVDTVWAQVPGGPRWPVYAREDDRLDALISQVAALTARVAALEA